MIRSMLIAVVTAGAVLFAPDTVTAASPDNGDAATAAGNAEPVAFDQPVTLNESVVVTGNYVRLGDVFANVGPLASEPITYAPSPGRKAVYDARWLFKIARHFGLPWRPFSMQDQTTVVRDSVIIDRGEIEDVIFDALVREGIDPEMSIELSNRSMRLYLPVDSDPEVAIEDVIYDERTRRFAAVIVAPANDPSPQRHRVTGQVHRMTEVPVLARRILADEVIRRNDIKWIRVRADRLSKDTLVSAADLIGMSPRNGLRTNTPVRKAEVEPPVLVERSSIVTIELRQPGMRLTAKGRALEDGAEGEVIRIANLNSNTVIEAQVAGPGRAVVDLGSALALN